MLTLAEEYLSRKSPKDRAICAAIDQKVVRDWTSGSPKRVRTHNGSCHAIVAHLPLTGDQHRGAALSVSGHSAQWRHYLPGVSPRPRPTPPQASLR
jgi:hypothetical protein